MSDLLKNNGIWIILGSILLVIGIVMVSGNGEKSTLEATQFQVKDIQQKVQEKELTPKQKSEGKLESESEIYLSQKNPAESEFISGVEEPTKSEFSNKISCFDCQYNNSGSCVDYCQGTDISCGCNKCLNCNKLDGWVNKGDTYSCCDNNKTCICQEQEYRDYYCSANSCSYSITKNQVNKVNCFDCGLNQGCSNGGCIFSKIEGLTTISIGGGIWGNWDADLEKDGAVINIVYLDASGDIITNEATKQTPISADVKVYAAPDSLTTPMKLVFSAHYSEGQIILGRSFYPQIRIPKEQINVNPNTDYQYGDVEVTISTPQQGLFSDRGDFIVLYEK